MSEKILCSKATKAAAKRLRYLTEREQNRRLASAGMSLAEAYMCGAEEAQVEIMQRLYAIPALGKSSVTNEEAK